MTRPATIDVARLLLTKWDPIGIQDEPQAQDEYVSYVSQIVRLIEAGASVQSVAESLLSIEHERMGLPGDAVRALAVAQALVALRG